ncbi:T9SS type A sorting domain-containing protein [Flavobacterium amnicola]|uniref:T9SS type A sorting domain-containing protein n=1 Tax=Flavobacterium amnicola TaxID=2506422 RepID=A0A4Q1K3I1_9FLAO|nr:T9SS type A sorting domain-containing protein [Flavobacterium amnicola]RXR19122.1 T9SS type A sorting domain-containing protein [Flavobacterium amnicola]
MKYITLLLFLATSMSAQYVSEAPWMKALANKNETASIEEMKQAYDNYWSTHDKNAKGSGAKLFMRWLNNNENQLNDDGAILTSQQLLDIFNKEKLNRAANRSSLAATSNWQPVFGTLPYNSNGQGRIQAVAVDPTNPNIIYVGTPAGSLWKSTNGGTSFVSLFDEFPQIGVSGIAIDPNNTNIIYIATGDRNHSDTNFAGVYKSTNGGASWTITGTISGPSRASDIYVNPSNSNMVWVATSSGVYKSINAGTSWTRTLTGNIKDIKIKPTDPTVVYAVSTTTFYRSTDSGSTFTAVTTGLPATSGRLVIDVTPANANYVYVLSSTTSDGFQGVYRSVDSGVTFAARNTTTDVNESTQSWYDYALGVSDTNAEEIYTGCLNVWKSTDGGTTLTRVNVWNSVTPSYTHADIHILRFFGNKLYCGSDGGIYVSTNGGTNFTDLTKTIQNQIVYKLAVAKQTSTKIMTGHQDNGCHAYINNNQWKRIQGGDGMDVAIDPNNQNTLYGFIQYGGSLYKNTTGGISNSSFICSAPAGETGTNDSGGNWVTPMAINSLGELYAGYTQLYKLVSNAWVQQNVTSFGTGDVELVEIDPSNDNIMYVINGSQIYKSTDKGINFTLIYTASSAVTSLCVHSTLSNVVYITTSGTSGQALKSTDGGATFTNIASGLPSIGKFCIKHQALNSSNPLYVGTNLGVYYIDDTMSTWQAFETNLPNVKVTDLDINYVDNNITAATFGRGIWQSPLPALLGTTEFMLENISIFPNPFNDVFNIRLGNVIPEKIEITDIMGKVIFVKNDFTATSETTIDLRNCSNGIYLVKIIADGKYSTKKIIKN